MSTYTSSSQDVHQPGESPPGEMAPPGPNPSGRPKPSRGGRMGTVLLTLVVALALVVSGLAAGWLVWGDQPEVSVTAQEPTAVASGEVDPVVGVAAAVLPTVVQIQSSTGLGSGVVYDSDGLILTAAHVVGGDTEVTVRLADGDQFAGEVVGADSNSDIAVISVDGNGLAAATLAVDSTVEVGQTAVALGSPYGLDQTVTAGVVSATDRAILGSDGVVRTAIQTDAPINPGNSGGPLADAGGRVIGINDAIFSRSGGNEGVGFAVPITVAKEVADHIVAGEPIETAFLGITGTAPAQGTAGVLVTGVEPGSPADDAGIGVGDLITAVGDKRVEDMVDLAGEIRAHQPGDEVVIHLQRSGEQSTVTVTLANVG